MPRAPRRVTPAVLLAFLAVGAVFAGCVAPEPAIEDESTDAGAVGKAPGLTRFITNLSVSLDGVTVLNSILEHYRLPMADGIMLDGWIVRPDVEEPVPIVLEVTPYYGGGPPIALDESDHFLFRVADELVPRGYAVGVVSVRGTGNSGGCFTQGGPEEAKDTAAVIEQLAAESWSNGNVGIIGVSYPGTTPQDVWIEAPPALKTIVPISGISDFYKYNFVNGVPINVQGFGFNTYYWVLVGIASGFPPTPNTFRDPQGAALATAGEACADQVWVQEGGVSSTVDGNKDAYWQVRDFTEELRADWNKSRASVHYIHGLQDWNVKPHMMEGWIEAVQETGVPFKALLGQWAHNWPQREDWWNSTLVAWFDYFLKDIENGILDAPAVQVQDDDGRWRHEAVWPPVDTWPLVYFPHEDGTLKVDEPGTGEATYNDYRALAPPDDATDHLVLFESEPLAENLTISGYPVFEGNVTASGRRASLMLTLIERTPQGDRAINFAALSLNHAESLASGKDDVSGATQHVRLQFFPQDDVFHKGSRVVLVASGNLQDGASPGPSLQPVSTGSMITLQLDGASLTLPVDATLVYEDPQPCWEGREEDENGDPIPGSCYLIR